MRRWRRTASGTALALIVGTLVVLAFKYDGKPFTEVQLNDGGVWVTNRDMGLVARLNPQVEELDLGVDATSADFDIFQRAADLYVDDETTDRSVKPVDIPHAAVEDATSLPTGAKVSHGGTTFAVVDAVSGKAWVRSAPYFKGFTAKGTAPDVTEAVTATVGTDGRAYVLKRSGRVEVVTVDASGRPVRGDELDLGDDVGNNPDMLTMTVVGQTPVLFNRSSLELTRPDAEPVVVRSDPSRVQLQQPSEDSDKLYLATTDGLFATSPEGGRLEKVSRGPVSGAPAAPVSLTSAHCVYAAWSDPTSPYNYLRDCAGEGHDDAKAIQGMQEGASLQFRVNRDVVVLNDVVTGDSWLVQDPGKAKIDNWPEVDPHHENLSKLKETTDKVPDQENRPPEPEDDTLGARPGRSTVLPVVALNDHDPDGDIISISKTQYVRGPELEVKIVGGGTQLQVTVPSDVDRSVPAVFRYYVTDGRVNEEKYAEVTLQIRDDAQESAPKRMKDREPRLTVARGKTSSLYLLSDFYDLDGDDLTLTDVTARGGEVEYRPDGTVTFTDNGDGGRQKEIQYTIEDGLQSLVGKLPVEVMGESAPPELVPDLKSGVAGTRVVVQPLSNDRNPEGGELRLKSVQVVGDGAGTEITKDFENGTFVFRSDKAKSYYLKYSAYNESATRDSFVRLDIESPPKDNRPPIAVGDKAVLSPGGTAQVDLLLNDLDPDGDVLVVKRIGRASIPGVKVSVVDKRLAVISSVADFAGQQATVEYVASDGRSSVTGHLVIGQRQSTQANRRPVANKDQVTVRAGSVVSVPVLANDSDPDGGKPRLFQSDLANEQDLDVWVAGDALRLRAPDKPGDYSVIYGVRDVDGLKATAEVAIYVVPDSARNNQAPNPQPIIDRVIAGRPKVISLDMTGADPDGDSVSFRGIVTAPSYGRILDTGVDWLRYEAFEGKTGTDFFQVRVQDKYGATGVAEVRVGVVSREQENQPPVALDDNVLVQPDRTISYNVLTNDIDPDDDPLRIESLNASASRDKPKAGRGFVELSVGDAPKVGTSVTNVGYTIADAAGAQDNAVLKVTASRDAPFYAPVARDDVADLGDIIGRKPGATVDVPVLDNDLDFDGAKADLEVEGCDPGAKGRCEVIRGKTAVRVTLKAEDQVVLYRLDDADEESPATFGVIFVSGTDNVPPQLTTDPERVPVKVTAGERKVLDLHDLVVTRAGREPSIVADSAPTAINGTVSPVQGDPTAIAFKPGRGLVGPASVTVDVTDGRSAAEQAALTSLVTIPIDVAAAGNVPPVMRDASVDIATSDDPVELDLAGLTTDANEGDLKSMTYSVASADKGVSGSIDQGGTIIAVDAGRGAKDGDRLKINVVADDGKGGRGEGTINVRIVGTSRPLLQIPPRNVTGERGQEIRVDLAEEAVNPYRGEPIKASNPRVEGTGRLSGLKVDGSTVSFTPASTGTSTVKVTVSDASGDRARDVTARINVTVIDQPEAPERPTVSSVEASSAVLSWHEPEANGAPITSYEVAGSHGYERTCPATTCRLDDLTPGQTYTFTVRAVNSEGPSDPSPPSQQIEPNKAPDLMGPPVIEVAGRPTGSAMDRKLTLRWTEPANEGSPITGYEIKEAGSARTWMAAAGARTYTIPGLSNGTQYAFEIRAVNKVEPRREFSGPSRSVAPFGVPMPSGAEPRLTANEAGDWTEDPWVRVDWSPWSDSQSNGNRISSYTVTCDKCHPSSVVVPASVTSKTWNVGDGIQKGTTFTFTVAATNDAGTSDRSPGVQGRPWTRAGPVRGLREVGSSPSDSTARVTWDAPADDGGLGIRSYVLRTDTGRQYSYGSAPGSGGALVDFGSNDANHSVTVWAVTANGDRSVDGQTDSVGGIHTWGKPAAPPATVVDSNDPYRAYMRVYAGSANGQSVTGVEISTDEGAHWSPFRSGGTEDVEVHEGGTTASILARTVSAAPDDDRKYSDPQRLTGVSRAKQLTVDLRVALNLKIYIYLKLDGFNNTRDAHAVVNVSGIQQTENADCALDQDVPYNFDGHFGGGNCWFNGGLGDQSVSANVDGVAASGN
ncbi:MAG TPA: Ig-like domain-containing protein [Nocardioides sp.]|nr:Ig-like domain-containing protein [Nocardioides sp.]